jgi:hypothetical protein
MSYFLKSEQFSLKCRSFQLVTNETAICGHHYVLRPVTAAHDPNNSQQYRKFSTRVPNALTINALVVKLQ